MPGELHLGNGDSPVSRGSALGLEASLSGVSQIPGQLREGPGLPRWQPGWGAGLVSALLRGLSHVPVFLQTWGFSLELTVLTERSASG